MVAPIAKKMLSSAFDKNSSKFQTVEFDNCKYLSRRLGPGETLNFILIDDFLYIEDYKGSGRQNILEVFDIDSITRPILDGAVMNEYQEGFALMHTDDNPGHCFSNLINALYIYKTNNLSCQILVPQTLLNVSRAFMEIILSFVDFENISIFDSGDVVFCKKMHLYQGSWFFKYRYDGAFDSGVSDISTASISNDISAFFVDSDVNFFLKKIASKKFSFLKYDKVALIKSSKNLSSNELSRSFSHSYDIYLEELGFHLINPETLSIFELCHILQNAKLVVTSWGAISFINKIFLSPQSIVIMLVHKGYSGEYSQSDWQARNCYMPICKEIRFLWDVDSGLNSRTKSILSDFSSICL